MTSPRDDGIWIVMAAYNEAARLGPTLDGLCPLYRNIVVVDDGSRDDTRSIALRYPVWSLRHSLNCGQGAALQTGIDFALRQGAQVLVTFDADGQHSPADIARMTEPILDGRAEVTLGSRFLGEARNIPRERYLVLKLGVLFTRWVSRIQVTDTHNGLRAFARHAAEKLTITQNGMAHASEILDRIRQQRWRFIEVPVRIEYTPQTIEKGQSSWNALKIAGQFLLGRSLK